MKKFTSSDKFNIIGKGVVFTVEDVKTEEIPTKGEIVEINEEIYTVKGIEMFKKLIPNAKLNIGILI